MNGRPSLDSYFLTMLHFVATRSTCVRRAVGAIIVGDYGIAKHQILATGYNGVPRGFDHCNEGTLCLGANDQKGDTSRCMAVHAEQNALMQCRNLEGAHTMYVSCAPCFVCAKMILNTPIKRVVSLESYQESGTVGASILLRGGVDFVVAENFKP